MAKKKNLTADEYTLKALHNDRKASKAAKDAPLPPPPAKHKRFSFPLFHHSSDLHTDDLSTPKTSHEKENPKDRRTSSATTATPSTKAADQDGIAKTEGAPPKRPTMGEINRQNSVQTRYMTMLLHLDEISPLHNILASFFTWILLAGFVIFPGTFTTIQAGKFDDKAKSESAAAILRTIKNVPLLVIAASACGVGASGMCWLWWRWRGNYVWLVNRIFLPGSLNSFAGLISTLVNVYTQQNKVWSLTAKVTAIVTGACMAVTAGLLLLYNMWYLERVRKDHTRNWVGVRREGEEGDEESKLPGAGVLGKI